MRTTISVLLLTFITAVTAGFLVYPHIMGLIDRMKNAFPAQPLTLEAVSINETCITLTVRNSGTLNLRIIRICVNDKIYGLAETIVISSGSIKTLQLTGNYVKGNIYKVKLECYPSYFVTFNVPYE